MPWATGGAQTWPGLNSVCRPGGGRSAGHCLTKAGGRGASDRRRGGLRQRFPVGRPWRHHIGHWPEIRPGRFSADWRQLAVLKKVNQPEWSSSPFSEADPAVPPCGDAGERQGVFHRRWGRTLLLPLLGGHGHREGRVPGRTNGTAADSAISPGAHRTNLLQPKPLVGRRTPEPTVKFGFPWVSGHRTPPPMSQGPADAATPRS